MGEMKQLPKHITSREAVRKTDYLTLYDKYGSMAYGIILRIVPEPELAQAVLVDLFSCQELSKCVETKAHTAGEIIRLARHKALSAASKAVQPTSTLPVDNTNEPLEKRIFDLSFCEGYTSEAIAEKLQVSSTSVLKSIYTYFKYLRSS